MGFYEIMFVVRPDLEQVELDEVLGGLQGEISKNGGTVDRLQDWRKRRLAYEIDKLNEGYYFLAYFSGQGTIIPEIEHYFRVTDAIIRYMVVRMEEKDYSSAVVEVAKEATETAEAPEAAGHPEESIEPVASEQSGSAAPEAPDSGGPDVEAENRDQADDTTASGE